MSKKPIDIDIILEHIRMAKQAVKLMIILARKTKDPRLDELERIYRLLSESENINYWFLKKLRH